MVDAHKKSECCGCGACKLICPRDAIKMLEDEEGFMYPKVMEDKCIKCKLCINVCPVLNVNIEKKNPIAVKAVKASNDIRANSQSGGLFYVLAREVLNHKGSVFGVGFAEDLAVVHIEVDKATLYKLQGSKYVQSDLQNCFFMIEERLAEKEVLFSGTPCQVAALKQYLSLKQVSTDNLLTIDVVCHGVSSPKIYKEFLKLYEKEYGGKIISVDFRVKNEEYKWGTRMGAYSVENVKTMYSGEYLDVYSDSVMSRPSCADCVFNTIAREGDITVGDYWGIDAVAPEFQDGLGASLALISTKKGMSLYERISSQLCDLDTGLEEAIKEQPNLRGISSKPFGNGRKKFWWYYRHFGLKIALECCNYRKTTLFAKLIRAFYKCISYNFSYTFMYKV